MAMGPIHSGGRRGRRSPMAEINVTPMVDVMLVLLIIFMVTAPLLVAGVPVNLPDSSAGALDQQKQPLEISIDREGRIFVGDEAVPEAQLPNIFAARRAAGGGEGPPVFLRADRTLDYGRVMRVMGELNRAGLNKVSLVTTGGAGDES
jgi:biopolymer transport protein TolR